jgi:hypothetical protein
MFNKEKETNEAIGMIKDMSKLFEALNTRQSKNTDLTFQTTMRFLTLMEVLVEKRIITPDESTRIMSEGKDD